MNPEDNDNEIEPGAEATKTPDTNLDQEPDAEKLPEGEADETAEEGAVEAESNEETSPGDVPGEVPEEEEEDLEATVADLNDKLLRALAETENIRRRAVRDKEDASKYAISNFARDMLALSDNLHRAMDSVDPATRQKDAAVEQIHKGSNFGRPSYIETELAQDLVDLIPGAEMVNSVFNRRLSPASSIGSADRPRTRNDARFNGLLTRAEISTRVPTNP